MYLISASFAGEAEDAEEFQRIYERAPRVKTHVE
jgi:hypothetical protein